MPTSSSPAHLRYVRDEVEMIVADALGFSITSFPVEGHDQPRRQLVSSSGSARPASEAENLMYKTLIAKEKFIRALAVQMDAERAKVDEMKEWRDNHYC